MLRVALGAKLGPSLKMSTSIAVLGPSCERLVRVSGLVYVSSSTNAWSGTEILHTIGHVDYFTACSALGIVYAHQDE